MCPDQSCEPLFCNYSRETFDKGASYFCWGRIKEPHVFFAKETEHKNEYHQCIYTPIKGHIMFFITADDAWSDFLGSATVMDNWEPLKCDECGPISRKSGHLHIFKDSSRLCSMCAVRLGKIKWHPEEKRYY